MGEDDAAEVARRFFSNPSQDAYDAYSKVCLPLYSNPNAAVKGSFRERAIECPTLVIGGTIDPVTPPICSEEIADAIGDNASLKMFAGCGHGPHRDDSEGAEKVMRSFLANHI